MLSWIFKKLVCMVTLEAVQCFPLWGWLIAYSFYTDCRGDDPQKSVIGTLTPLWAWYLLEGGRKGEEEEEQ